MKITRALLFQELWITFKAFSASDKLTFSMASSERLWTTCPNTAALELESRIKNFGTTRTAIPPALAVGQIQSFCKWLLLRMNLFFNCWRRTSCPTYARCQMTMPDAKPDDLNNEHYSYFYFQISCAASGLRVLMWWKHDTRSMRVVALRLEGVMS